MSAVRIRPPLPKFSRKIRSLQGQRKANRPWVPKSPIADTTPTPLRTSFGIATTVNRVGSLCHALASPYVNVGANSLLILSPFLPRPDTIDDPFIAPGRDTEVSRSISPPRLDADDVTQGSQMPDNRQPLPPCGCRHCPAVPLALQAPEQPPASRAKGRYVRRVHTRALPSNLADSRGSRPSTNPSDIRGCLKAAVESFVVGRQGVVK